VLGRLDEAMGMMNAEVRRLFKLGLRAFEWAPMAGFFSRFSTLDDQRRAAAVRSWEHGSYTRQAILLSLRYQVGMAYFESDAARKACGWSMGCAPSTSEG